MVGTSNQSDPEMAMDMIYKQVPERGFQPDALRGFIKRKLFYGGDVFSIPIGSMYGIYANIGGILMVNVAIYSIHGSYGIYKTWTVAILKHHRKHSMYPLQIKLGTEKLYVPSGSPEFRVI